MASTRARERGVSLPNSLVSDTTGANDMPRRNFADDIDYMETQDVSVGNINPAKLVTLLRAKFGVGSYDIHVRFPWESR